MILSGDVGGTKTRLALFEIEKGRPCKVESETFSSRQFSRLEEILEAFLSSRNVRLEGACLGVPGPVVEGRAQVTNLPWCVDAAKLLRIGKFSRVRLVNDLVATAASVPYLSAQELTVLHPAVPITGEEQRYGILAPGTGLGQAFLIRHGDRDFQELASEGGHCDFAPRTRLESDLLHYLISKFGRASYERVLSGPGLVNIYQFLRSIGFDQESPRLARRLKNEDPATVISSEGLSGRCRLCIKALDIFASVLGAQAGNMVLELVATDGIYIGGGIAPRIREKLQDGTVSSAYLQKGRLSYLVEKTPLCIIRDDSAALIGAASLARGRYS